MGTASYSDFIQSKLRAHQPSGFTSRLKLSENLFPHQSAIAKWALRMGRAAIFADAGLGKTRIQLEWARHVTIATGKPVLIFAPLTVARQTMAEGQAMGVRSEVIGDPIHIADGRPGIYLTNYDRFERFRDCGEISGGLVLDECFAAGTLVDTPEGPIPIETIHPGQFVHNAVGASRVVATKSKMLQSVCKIVVNGSAIYCSKNHPFFTENGVTFAQDLMTGDSLYGTREAMRILQTDDRECSEAESFLQQILLSEMENAPTRNINQGPFSRSLQKERRIEEKVSRIRASLSHGGNRTHSESKSDVEPIYKKQGICATQGDGARTSRERGQWKRNDYSSGITPVGGRIQSSLSQAIGREKGRGAAQFRVDSIEVLEQGHPEFSSLSRGKDFVKLYDLQVENHPSYSVAGILVHNSSILKSVNGKIRGALLESYQQVPYRLACTATPAPNDITEIANHAEFLGIKRRTEMLATWFVHDDEGWRLKRHATGDFYRWLASWSVYLRKPSDLGFPDDGYDLPPLNVRQVSVECDVPPEGFLFATSVSEGVVGHSRARRASLAARVEATAKLIESEPGESWIVWCGLNDESDALEKRLAKLGHLIVRVEGPTSEAEKIDRIDRFTSGEARILLSKPRVCGFGLNLQIAARQIFCGIGYSWEQYYQCLRRSWRFGQTREVTAYVVTSEMEDSVVSNVLRKEQDAKQMGDQIIANVKDLECEAVHGKAKTELPPGILGEKSGDTWRLIHGDCVEAMEKEIEPDSIDLSVFSPPFATLFTYSDNARDMGNSANHEEFFGQFRFFVRSLLKVTKPGRLACVHVAQIATTLGHDGQIGINDFRGKTIQTFIDGGWVFHRECCIQKDPQALRNGTPVMTPVGWKDIELLQVGDQVTGKSGEPTTVLGVWPQGERPLYRVTFRDGSFVDCDGRHKWDVSNNGHSKKSIWQTITTEDILAKGLTTPSGLLRWRIPNSSATIFSSLPMALPIDPYTMGVLLGDGCISQDRCLDVTTDREIADSLPLPCGHSVKQRPGSERAGGNVATFGIVCEDWHRNDVLDALRAYSLQGKRAWEKFIPEDYLYASVAERKALLAGLLDTDGTVKKNGSVCYSTTSPGLAEGIQFLARSVGGNATLRTEKGGKYEYKGESRQGREIYCLNLSLNIGCPFRLMRKAEKWTFSNRDSRRVIASIEPIENSHCTCITVDASDGLFVIKDFLVTHNSQAIRTHSKALLFVQKNKDRSWIGPALADYILVFRKPGENAVLIDSPDVSNNDWIEWARPIWLGIKETNTLNTAEGKGENDERHICPLQLGTIERCVKLWSNPGELVLSPFAGIGSEGYQSILSGRRFVGVELKPEYYKTALKNLKRAENQGLAGTLFDEDCAS